MTSWICPECGGECSQACSECPVCTGKSAIEASQAVEEQPVTEEPPAQDPNAPEQTVEAECGIAQDPMQAGTDQTVSEHHNEAAATGAETSAAQNPPEAPREASAETPDLEQPEHTPDSLAQLAAFATQSTPVHNVFASAAGRPFAPVQPSSWTNGLAGAWEQVPVQPLVFGSAREISKPALPSFPALPRKEQHAEASAAEPPNAAANPIAKGLFPSWARTAVTVLVIGLFASYLTQKFATLSGPNTSTSSGRAVPSRSKPGQAAAVAPEVISPAPDSSSEPEYPYARFVEVTDLRVVPNGDRAEVDYLVINHSSSELTDIGLKITVRSANAHQGMPPLFTLAARVPVLASHQSKEIRTTLDLAPSEIPSEDNLRTEVKVVSEQ